MTGTQAFAQVGNARIQYLEAGQGEPVVFFHGAGGVEPNAAFISIMAARYRMLLPSRPGFDESTGEPETIRDVADIMAGFIRQVAGGPVRLMAESAGGAPACWLAVLHPELVTTLILAAPAAFMQHAQQPAGPPPSPEEFDRRLFGANPGWIEPPSAESTARRRRNSAYNMARWRSPDGNADLRARLPEIQAPTLVLWGTADEVIPPAQGEIYAKAIPGARLVSLPGAAHALTVAEAPKFVELATGFIEHELAA